MNGSGRVRRAMFAMNPYQRPAWIEIDLRQLQKNFEFIQRDKPAELQMLFVVKDQAYGHGAYECAQVGLRHGVRMLAVATVGEAAELRDQGITAPILLFGQPLDDQFEFCLHYDLTICLNSAAQAAAYARCAERWQKIPNIQIEIDTGLSRYGVRWSEAASVIEQICAVPGLRVEGLMSHFAMSDELDKSYAMQQLERFWGVLNALEAKKMRFPLLHLCNSGGFLDLPQAHFDLVRLGILPLGVFPSKVCRHIPGIQPIMRVKARIAAIQEIQAGDHVGYGMHYTAPAARRIAVLPLGYGDGFPRVRNAGDVLIHGQRAAIVGGNAMDAMMVDITAIPAAQIGDEVVLLGQQGHETIAVQQLAELKRSVSYDILTNWSWRLPRVFIF